MRAIFSNWGTWDAYGRLLRCDQSVYHVTNGDTVLGKLATVVEPITLSYTRALSGPVSFKEQRTASEESDTCGSD